MKIFNTADLNEKSMHRLSVNERAWIYNGLDCCVTADVFNTLSEHIETDEPNIKETYQTALDKMAPYMEMSLRGVAIDFEARDKTIKYIEKIIREIDDKFQRLMQEIVGGSVNWRSHVQLKGLFYTVLGLKEIKKRNANGIFTATVNEEALERLQVYLIARPLSKMVLSLRNLDKQLSFLKTKIDPDNRIRTTYNLAGTNTGRLSSSMSEFGTGTNLQNVNRKLRNIFTADPGMYMVNIDLEQADGRNVGAICHELFHREKGTKFASSYLDACESGDLHTAVCYMTWPELEWPKDKAEWKSFCDALMAHGQDSYRQLAKKLGHGTNYYGTPRTMAKHAHVPTKIIEDFQERYFKQFPCIPAWHKHVIDAIQSSGTITTLFGRRRMFFGRGNDKATWRKAIAFEPQSMTGEEIDRGLVKVWKEFPQVQLLIQVHDSILLQIPFSEAEELIPKILETLKITLTLEGGRLFTVPLEAAGGWNWGYADKDNPYGLKKWKGTEERDRPNPRRRIKDYLK